MTISKQILVHDIQLLYSVGPDIPTIFTSGSRPREVWEPLPSPNCRFY